MGRMKLPTFLFERMELTKMSYARLSSVVGDSDVFAGASTVAPSSWTSDSSTPCSG